MLELFSPEIFLPFAIVMGLIMGSFSTLLLHRLAHQESGIVTGRSRCPQCQHQLAWFDLFPVLSWVFSGGRCRYCKTRIAVSYPLIELSFATLWGWGGYQVLALQFSAENSVTFLLSSLSAFGTMNLILLLFWYDTLYKFVDLRILALAVLLVGVEFGLSTPQAWDTRLLGAVVGAAFWGGQYWLSGGKWVGDGDLFLGILVGLMVGIDLMFETIALAYLLGMLIVLPLWISGQLNRKSAVPLGSFLLPVAMTMWWHGEVIKDWYWGWFTF